MNTGFSWNLDGILFYLLSDILRSDYILTLNNKCYNDTFVQVSDIAAAALLVLLLLLLNAVYVCLKVITV